jgi:indolepyruvate ferredoxin oxidoreductase beta subunit
MRYDIVLAGVGGQGVLSMAGLIARAAMSEGLDLKQSEVHGMAQRGGAVQAHLRLSDEPIESDLIPRGSAGLILSLEPVEGLRYLPWLSPTGTLVTSANAFVNIPDYPPQDEVLRRVRTLPRALVVEAERLAEESGDLLAVNTVMVGAASRLLPIDPSSLEEAVRTAFGRKGERSLAANLAAFEAGRRAGA